MKSTDNKNPTETDSFSKDGAKENLTKGGETLRAPLESHRSPLTDIRAAGALATENHPKATTSNDTILGGTAPKDIPAKDTSSKSFARKPTLRKPVAHRHFTREKSALLRLKPDVIFHKKPGRREGTGLGVRLLVGYFRSKRAVFSLVVLGALLCVMLVSGFLPSYLSGCGEAALRAVPPIWKGGLWSCPLGTDVFGRNVFLLVIESVGYSLSVALLVLVFSTLLAVPLGVWMAVQRKRWWVRLSEDILELVLAVPGVLLVLAVAAFFVQGLWMVVFVVGVIYGASLSHDTYRTLSRELALPYAQSAYMNWRNYLYVAFFIALPNCISFLSARLAMNFAAIVMDIAAADFLRLGASHAAPQWGVILADAFEFGGKDVILIVAIGGLMFMTIASSIYIGEGIRKIIRDFKNEEGESYQGRGNKLAKDLNKRANKRAAS